MKVWIKKKKRIMSIVVVMLVVALTGGALSYHFLFAKEAAETSYQEVSLQKGDLTLAVTGTGTTKISTVSQTPEFQTSAVTLEVEEVYTSSGATVEAGDALLKLTANSVVEAKTYYSEKVAAAQRALQDAQASYNVGVLEAQYDKEKTQTTAEYAESEYQASVSELDQKVADAKSELETAQSKIATYTSNLENNTYYTDNKIDEKEAAVTTAEGEVTDKETTYKSAVKTYNDLNKTVTKGIAALSKTVLPKTVLSATELAEQVAQLTTDFESLNTAKDNADKAKEELEKAQNNLNQKKSESEQAQKSYEKQVEEATQQKEQLQNSLSQLQTSYEEASRNAVTEKVKLKNTYETAMVNGEYAQTTYESTTTSLQKAIDTAQENLETLTEQQVALLALEDGVVTASQTGTIASISYEVGDTLSSNTAIVSYYNTDTIMISIQVSQSDISRMAVGDSTDVSITGVRGGNLTGTISSIATEATADTSASKVTYEVVVNVDNSDGTISTGLSATVSYHYGDLEGVYYLAKDAVSGIDGTKATVKQYDENGEVQNVAVTIGEQTDSYIVITEGISEGDICLIENGGKSNEEK